MKLSVVLSVQQTAFLAATFSGALEDNFAKIASMGYQGVELTIRDPRLVDLDRLASLVDKSGLTVPAIGTGQAWGEDGLSFTDPDVSVRRLAIERVQSHVPIAACFGAAIIIGLIRGTLKPGVDPDQAYAWMVDALRECAEAAAIHGVNLVLEPLNRYETILINTASQGMELMEKVGEDNLGLLLDTFHMNIEEPEIERSIEQCREKILHFHVADSNRWYPGAGHLDFASILKTLALTGYNGFVSGEFLAKPDAESAARNSIAHLKTMIANH